MNINERVAEKIRQLRENKGLSQKAVAQALFRSRQAYGDLENGKKKIEIEDLAQIATFHNQSLMYFLSDFERL